MTSADGDENSKLTREESRTDEATPLLEPQSLWPRAHSEKQVGSTMLGEREVDPLKDDAEQIAAI